MIKKINHVGVAVKDAAAAKRTFVDVLGLADNGEETLDHMDLMTVFCGAKDVNVELIQSLSDDTPIATYIEKRGQGLHHICFEVDGLDAMLDRCRESGIVIIGDGPQEGAQGKRVAFLHPKSTGGVLIELSEDARRNA